MLAGGHNHIGRLTMQKLLGTGVIGRRSINAQQRKPSLDVQTSAAAKFFADRLAGREGGNDSRRQGCFVRVSATGSR